MAMEIRFVLVGTDNIDTLDTNEFRNYNIGYIAAGHISLSTNE